MRNHFTIVGRCPVCGHEVFDGNDATDADGYCVHRKCAGGKRLPAERLKALGIWTGETGNGKAA